jgi:hypothetical protein
MVNKDSYIIMRPEDALSKLGGRSSQGRRSASQPAQVAREAESAILLLTLTSRIARADRRYLDGRL